MKLAFVVCNQFFIPQVMELLRASDIDYYTRWDDAKGKGRGTEPHLGTGGYASMNVVFMIAFDNTVPLQTLIGKITELNAQTLRTDDHVRLFQLPLERIV